MDGQIIRKMKLLLAILITALVVIGIYIFSGNPWERVQTIHNEPDTPKVEPKIEPVIPVENGKG